jgi:hypothetical protein
MVKLAFLSRVFYQLESSQLLEIPLKVVLAALQVL